MKKAVSLLFIFLLVGFSAFANTNPDVLSKPDPMRLVVDRANLLSSDEQNALERKLVAFDDSTSNQICVAIVPSLNGRILEEVATATFRAWGIGNKSTNNGVLLLIVMDERKIKIEVGYGLEGAIPDIVCGDIIRKDLTPAFREGNFYKGIDEATSDLEKASNGEYHTERDISKGNAIGGSILGFILFIIVISLLFRRGGGGGLLGGILLGDMLGNSGGGWSDGGGWSGGGGFGGFGGGMSGGGGASGGW